MEITGYILAGGNSSRMGFEKGLAEYKEKSLVAYSVKLLQVFTPEIKICTNNKAYEKYRLPLIHDIHQGAGPIAGLHAALENTSTELNLFLPCDMPFLKAETIQKLLPFTDNFQAVVLGTKNNHKIPTVGIYKKSALQVIEHQISKSDYKLHNLVDGLNSKVFIVEDEQQLVNINTPDDLA